MAKTDTLLGHCLARAALAGGYEGTGSATWAVVKSTTKAARVAAFIVLWAVEVRENGPAESNADMARRLGDSDRTFYRHLADFRELWPEYETPDALGALLLDALPEGDARPSPLVPLAL
jgi:hypothetical protein